MSNPILVEVSAVRWSKARHRGAVARGCRGRQRVLRSAMWRRRYFRASAVKAAAGVAARGVRGG